jgi:DNA-binding winged helix-turn-helix (wHTH) protein
LGNAFCPALFERRREVRKALGDDARQPQFIETRRGLGYRFLGTVSDTPEPREQLAAAMPIKPARAQFVR